MQREVADVKMSIYMWSSLSAAKNDKRLGGPAEAWLAGHLDTSFSGERRE